MSAPSPHDRIASAPASAQSREISTRANLGLIEARLEKLNNHLSVAMSEHWGKEDTPMATNGIPGALVFEGAPKATPGHPEMIEHIHHLLSSIEDRVEFISARL